MKKKQYIAPESKVIVMDIENHILALSQGGPAGEDQIGEKPSEYVPGEGQNPNDLWEVN